METSQATIQLKGIRKKYLWKFIFHVFILYSLVIILGCLYILPIYNILKIYLPDILHEYHETPIKASSVHSGGV